MNSLLFYIVLVLIGASSLGLILSKRLFHSALFLLVILLVVAATFIIAGAEFLGVAQILVYIGGILILLLFGIIVTDQKKKEDYSLIAEFPAIILAGILGFIFFKAIGTFVGKANAESEMNYSNTEQIGYSLISSQLFALEFVALLLLVSLVGAVILGSRKSK